MQPRASDPHGMERGGESLIKSPWIFSVSKNTRKVQNRCPSFCNFCICARSVLLHECAYSFFFWSRPGLAVSNSLPLDACIKEMLHRTMTYSWCCSIAMTGCIAMPYQFLISKHPLFSVCAGLKERVFFLQEPKQPLVLWARNRAVLPQIPCELWIILPLWKRFQIVMQSYERAVISKTTGTSIQNR